MTSGRASRPDAQLYLDDHRGIYIPRDFADGTKRECVEGIDQGDWDTIASGPDHEWYWEAWDAICQDAILTDPATKVRYTLHQDGALWIVPVGMTWDDREGWVWPPDEDETDVSSSSLATSPVAG